MLSGISIRFCRHICQKLEPLIDSLFRTRPRRRPQWRARRALGYDARLTQTGLLVCLIATQVANGRATMPILTVDDADLGTLMRVLTHGQSSALGGASITLRSRTDGADVVRAVRP